MAELILNHARANECQDVPQFKKEMAELVDQALSNTLSLGKVQTWIVCPMQAHMITATTMLLVIMLL